MMSHLRLGVLELGNILQYLDAVYSGVRNGPCKNDWTRISHLG